MTTLLRRAWRAALPLSARAQAYRFYEGALVLAVLGRNFLVRSSERRRGRTDYRQSGRPLRVLMVSGSFPPIHCGVGDYTARLSDALRCRPDIDIRVVTTAAPRVAAAPSYVEPAVERWQAGALHNYARVLRNFKPDIVHVQYPAQGYGTWSGPAAVAGIARRTTDARIVQTWHEYPQSLLEPAGWTLVAMGLVGDAMIYVRPDYENHLHGPLKSVARRMPRHFVPNAAAVPAVDLAPRERQEIRDALQVGERRMIAHFGFAHPHKGVHRIFEVANPASDHIVLIGELNEADPYHAKLLQLTRSAPWQGRVTLCGFVDSERAARILAAADAVVFPFEKGGGIWNSSVHAAVAQGTLTIVTSTDRSGYVPDENTFYVGPGQIAEMRAALDAYAQRRNPARRTREWDAIAQRHVEIYRETLERSP